MNHKALTLALAVASTALHASLPASAETDPAAFVRSHVEKIASGDTGALSGDYLPGAFLWWVGGPLDGTYLGSSISAVWKKFAAAQGNLRANVTSMTVSANPKGQTVVADVTYSGSKGSLNVRQVVLVRDGQVQDEIWQISPKTL